MTANMNRRNFLKGLVPQLGQSNGPAKKAPESPFPGHFSWNFAQQRFDPVFSVTENGQLLTTPQDPQSFATILTSPTNRQFYWNFSIGQWILPLAYDAVMMRSVLGKKLIKQCFHSGMYLPQVAEWTHQIKTLHPGLDINDVTFMGLNEKGDPYPEDILTLGFIHLTDATLENHQNFLNIKLPQKPTRYAIKVFLQSGEMKMKAVYHVPNLIAEPPVNLTEHFLWGMAHTFNSQQGEELCRDILFSARDVEVNV